MAFSSALVSVALLSLLFTLSHTVPIKDDEKKDVEVQKTGKLSPQEAEKLTGTSLIDYINNGHQKLWRARTDGGKFSHHTLNQMSKMMGVKHSTATPKADRKLLILKASDDSSSDSDSSADDGADLPESFDSRVQWPNCPGINEIRDQSSCGSCWALSSVESMSDRTCIASNATVQVTLSAVDLLSCCDSCGYGCQGGDPYMAMEYWHDEGIVTGSNYTLNEYCKPYPFAPCEHHSNKTGYAQCPDELYDTPKCTKKCQKSYNVKYKKDRHYGTREYGYVSSDPVAIQRELIKNGPLVMEFEVYADFLDYETGIYSHEAGSYLGGHAVKLIGWGVEDDTDYWLIANSWNTDWGDQGFFKMIRGTDDCGIESGVVGGLPKLKKTN